MDHDVVVITQKKYNNILWYRTFYAIICCFLILLLMMMANFNNNSNKKIAELTKKAETYELQLNAMRSSLPLYTEAKTIHLSMRTRDAVTWTIEYKTNWPAVLSYTQSADLRDQIRMYGMKLDTYQILSQTGYISMHIKMEIIQSYKNYGYTDMNIDYFKIITNIDDERIEIE